MKAQIEKVDASGSTTDSNYTSQFKCVRLPGFWLKPLAYQTCALHMSLHVFTAIVLVLCLCLEILENAPYCLCHAQSFF